MAARGRVVQLARAARCAAESEQRDSGAQVDGHSAALMVDAAEDILANGALLVRGAARPEESRRVVLAKAVDAYEIACCTVRLRTRIALLGAQKHEARGLVEVKWHTLSFSEGERQIVLSP
jgi:hypothetical protein